MSRQAFRYDMSRRLVFRAASPELDELLAVVFSRYPNEEAGAFIRCGFRVTPTDLVVTLASVARPTENDVDASCAWTKFRHPYIRRTALAAETDLLAVGVVHSHPQSAAPEPSAVDDEMDSHLADYFAGFAPGRPYASIILSRDAEGGLSIAGRAFHDGVWLALGKAVLEGHPGLQVWSGGKPPVTPEIPPERVARLTSAFGREAYQRLRRSVVAVIGAGGTGSIAIPTLARAGVGTIIIADSDHVTASNLERMHASRPEHIEERKSKALLAKEHVASIDPDIRVHALSGRLPQREIVDLVATADVLIGCTDQQSSRLALSDIARRYLVPAIDCGGLIEGANGRVTGQIIQLVRFRPADPCPHCRRMVSPVRVRQELMTLEERQALTEAALAGNLPPPPEAHEIPQIDTVGYITTVSGALAAGYAIGWLTGRFDPPFERLQMNLVADCLDVTNRPQRHDAACGCAGHRGHADQAVDAMPFAVPDHWPPVSLLSSGP